MPRWEQGSEERLTAAALQLPREQGFENASVVEIAQRARVTNRTFFRYFADKRESCSPMRTTCVLLWWRGSSGRPVLRIRPGWWSGCWRSTTGRASPHAVPGRSGRPSSRPTRSSSNVTCSSSTSWRLRSPMPSRGGESTRAF
ncbi:helix-turn-helix transcriptional regulator [Pseudonocardia sp. KRD-291]|nr:helix-turn-helix transcriptional regulator [Pseudonocardia sp. KRD291]